MDEHTDSEINALLTSARKLRQQAEETTLLWYRKRLLTLARDIETRAGELEERRGPNPKKKGPDTVRPLRPS